MVVTSLDLQVNQIPPLVGQDDLFEVLQVELGHIGLIRNILPMQWNRKVQLTSKYSCGDGPTSLS